MEHVIRVTDATGMGEIGATLKTDFLAGQALHGGQGSEIRGSSAAIVTLADTLAATRDLTSPTDKVSYHVCRHDEGTGRCSEVAK